MTTDTDQSVISFTDHGLELLIDYLQEISLSRPFYISRCHKVLYRNISLKPQTEKQCRGTGARKNSLERQEPKKKPREEPGFEGWPVLFWLCRVEIITEHGQYVHTFIDDQQGQIIIITVVVEGATGQHLRSKCQFAFHS